MHDGTPLPLLDAHAGLTAAPRRHEAGAAEWSLGGCRLVDLPRVQDPRGNLTFIEGGVHIDFEIRRVYYIYDVPGGSERGGHAHRGLHQLVIAMSGSFDVVLDDGRDRTRVHLNRSYRGLYICPMIWRELDNFSSGSVCMVLASQRYDEDDYLRDYGSFMRMKWA
jgi:dTDP-4-dehydrorhamnose 3,5-epimerase-like enzyme